MKINFRIITLILLIFNQNVRIFSKDTAPYNYIHKKNERVYVHLQKQVFVTGETLNYNAYVVNLSSLKPTNQSKVVYFAIRDTSNRLIMGWHGYLINGTCSGSIVLPDSIATGVYTFYAFTNWMRNISTSYFYNSRILIAKLNDKIPEKLTVPVPFPSHEPLVSFFPEGGHLVVGLINNIGFRINNPNICSNITSGLIKDNQGNLIDSLKFSPAGIGKFKLNPDTGKIYIAELITNNKGVITIPLPVPLMQGYTIHVENLPASFIIKINSNSDSHISNEQISVIARFKENEIFRKSVSLNNGSGSLQINKSLLPEGIIYLGIIKSDQNVVAERLIYHETKNKPYLKIINPKPEYGKREKITVEIEACNFSEKDILNLSVSVTSVNPFQSYLNNINIDHYFYLFSEIKNNPISDIGNEPVIQPDDLLLVTDIDHYAWSFSKQNNKPNCEYITEDKGFVLSGKVTVNDSITPDSNAIVLLSRADSISSLDYSYLDSTGKFHFLLDKQYDNKELILQLKEHNDISQNLSWKLDKKYDNVPTVCHHPIYLSSGEKQYLNFNSDIFLIKKIYNQIQIQNVPTQSEKESNFYCDPDYIIYPSDYFELNSFADISKNILPSVKFRNKKDTLSLSIIDYKNRYTKHNATVLLNGVPLYDLSYLNSLNSKDIKKIEVVKSEVIYGDLSFFGVISIQTTDGIIPSSYHKKYTSIYKNTVYENSSDQDAFITKNSVTKTNIPDLKQTLFWSPDITIHGNNKVTLEFSTSDLQSEYKINIQGFTNSGIPVCASAYFTVNN